VGAVDFYPIIDAAAHRDMKSQSTSLVNASALSEARFQEKVCLGALLRRGFDKAV